MSTSGMMQRHKLGVSSWSEGQAGSRRAGPSSCEMRNRVVSQQQAGTGDKGLGRM